MSDEPGLTIEPQIAPDPEGPIQSADRSTATVVGVDQSFSKTWFEADPGCSVTEMKKMMMANVTGSGAWAADEGCKAEPTPLRNEASLNCVSLRSELDCEVSCEAVKGQDERRRSAAPLTASQLTRRGICSTAQN